MNKPTQEQLEDPQWWSDNVPEEYDYAFTTGPYWNVDFDQSIVGSVEFAGKDGNQGAENLILRSDCWVLLTERPVLQNTNSLLEENNLLREAMENLMRKYGRLQLQMRWDEEDYKVYNSCRKLLDKKSP